MNLTEFNCTGYTRERHSGNRKTTFAYKLLLTIFVIIAFIEYNF